MDFKARILADKHILEVKQHLFFNVDGKD